MKQVLVRFEQASSKKLPVTSATPSQALIMPLMGLNIEQPPQYANVAEVNVTPAENGNANGINPLLNNTTPKTTPMQTPRGGGEGVINLSQCIDCFFALTTEIYFRFFYQFVHVL